MHFGVLYVALFNELQFLNFFANNSVGGKKKFFSCSSCSSNYPTHLPFPSSAPPPRHSPPPPTSWCRHSSLLHLHQTILFSKELLSIQYTVETVLSFSLVIQILCSIYIYLLYYTLILFAVFYIYFVTRNTFLAGAVINYS